MQPPEPSLTPVDSADGLGTESRRWTLFFGFGSLPGWKGEALVLAALTLITVVMTWPIAVTMDQATGLRGDYFNNIWNVWWLRHSLLEGHSPFWTDYLYYPNGLSLKRHTLSPLNAIAGVILRSFLSPNATFNAILLATFVFSAWTFSLFARYLTGSLWGALLGGLIYTFNPFHYFYICQVNVFSFQWLPLVLLYFARVYREGGRRNTILAAVFTGCMAATIEYYIIYACLTVGLMLFLGRWLDRDVGFLVGVRRLALAGALTGVAVCLVAFPLLLGTFGPEGKLEGSVTLGLQQRRANDLLGFFWIGGSEEATVSWPTMLGYSTLLLVALTFMRSWRRHRFWLAVAVFFGVLSLGKTLVVGGEDTGVPLVYEWLQAVPGLSMLRKPDRSFLMVQFVVALLVAESWIAVESRVKVGARRWAWGALAAVMLFELSGAPFERFDYRAPLYAEELAKDESVESVIEIPPMEVDVQNARYNLFQTVHEKKQPLGYCTALALNKSHNDQMALIVNTYFQWANGSNSTFIKWIKKKQIDRIIIYKTWPADRKRDPTIHDETFFQPFFLVKHKLVRIRQIGQYIDEPFPSQYIEAQKLLLFGEFGRPVHEDDEVVVYAVSGEGE